MSKAYGSKHIVTMAMILALMLLALTPMATASRVLTVEVSGNSYQIVNKGAGQMIEMEGFGYLMTPGKPMLPSRNFLIALPPGAGVQSVEVKGIGAEQLPGAYRPI